MLSMDIDEKKYNVTINNVTLFTVRRVTIKDNSLVVNNFVDHFGGTYEVTNETRSQTQSILSGAPISTGIADMDERNMDQRISAVVSLRELTEIYELDDDIRFEVLQHIVNLDNDIDLVYSEIENTLLYSMVDDLDGLETLKRKLEPIGRAVRTLAKGIRARRDKTLDVGAFSNAFRFNVKEIKSGLSAKGFSIKEANDAAIDNNIVDDDGNVMFDF